MLGYLLVKLHFWEATHNMTEREMFFGGDLIVDGLATAFYTSNWNGGMKIDTNAGAHTHTHLFSDLLNYVASFRSMVTNGAGGNYAVWAGFIWLSHFD